MTNDITQKQMHESVDVLWRDALAVVEAARRDISAQVVDGAMVLAQSLGGGGKILICGNGGSAADSVHFSSELVNKFMRERAALAAISLATDAPTLTSIANDINYDAVFARQVEALGRRGDVLVVITSSGNSPNIIEAVRSAHQQSMRCIALNGKDGGALSKAMAADDIDIIAPGKSTARIQEIHSIVIHAWCELIDRQLFGE